MNQKLTKIRQIFVALILFAAVEGFSSCEKYSFVTPKINPDIPVSFKTDIQPIFNKNCVACHGGTQFPNLSDGKSYTSLSKGGFITAPGETSGLYVQMNSSSHIARSSSVDKDKVLNWINQGALNN